MAGSRIIGLGHATPSRRIGNAEIERELGLEPGWIERRTGVRARRVCGPRESCSTLALDASRRALAASGLAAEDLGLVLLATSTPDHLLPPTAPRVAHELGCTGAGAVDLAGACAGFLYALGLADSHVRVHGGAVLVVAANVLSRRLDPRDAGARAIFADGAGAVVVANTSMNVDVSARVTSVRWDSKGSEADLIRVQAGGSVRPIDVDAVSEGLHFLRIERGQKVFTEAIDGMVSIGEASLRAAGLSSADIDLWVPHQANQRILDRAGEGLHLPRDRWMSILAEWGNSSAASIPTALSIAAEEGRIRKGSKVLATAVGAGLVLAAATLDFGGPPDHDGADPREATH